MLSLKGVARVLNPGKKLSDFRPGQPLEDTFTIYHNQVPPGTQAGFKVISHVEQLALSMCARKSNGKLWCGTCHDPHNDPLQPVQFGTLITLLNLPRRQITRSASRSEQRLYLVPHAKT